VDAEASSRITSSHRKRRTLPTCTYHHQQQSETETEAQCQPKLLTLHQSTPVAVWAESSQAQAVTEFWPLFRLLIVVQHQSRQEDPSGGDTSVQLKRRSGQGSRDGVEHGKDERAPLCRRHWLALLHCGIRGVMPTEDEQLGIKLHILHRRQSQWWGGSGRGLDQDSKPYVSH